MIINIYKDKKSKRCFNKDNLWHNSYGPDETHHDGYKTYYINNRCHNLHGPAAIYPVSKKEYWLDDIYYTKDEWEQRRHDY